MKCFSNNIKNLKMYVGVSDYNSAATSNIAVAKTIHLRPINTKNIRDDIALIKLQDPLTLSGNVKLLNC
jgi:hypothetical protein